MKGHWLRGLLLGLSLALLLSGGIALAQSLTVEPDCFQCWAGTLEDFMKLQPGYPFSYIWKSCGWSPGEELLYTERFLATNEVAYDEDTTADDSGCLSSEDLWGWSCDGAPLHHRSQAAADDGVFPDDHWGLMQICLDSATDQEASASARVCKSITFAEACAAEFVPEPGTLMLLGSGLAGLAGYATLRWRTRE